LTHSCTRVFSDGVISFFHHQVFFLVCSPSLLSLYFFCFSSKMGCSRRIAYFKKNLCIVYREYGDRQYAKKLAEEALANFKQEGIYEEIEKMKQLLDSLSLE
ncbi:MAG: hypothetical protein AAGE84_28285, partial [Cyanobacteria bacterium P01_G01_bin.39]